MHAGGVVEALNVGKHTATRFFTGLKASIVRLLDLQAMSEALHRRSALLAVLAVSRVAHRLPVAVVLQMRTQFCRSILTAFVRVKDKPFLLYGTPLLGDPGTKLGHPQRVHDQAGSHVRIHRQAFDLAGEQVEHAAYARSPKPATLPSFVDR